MAITEKQKEAINNFEKALSQLKKAKIRIGGMDQTLYYATEKMINKNKITQVGYYPDVAHTYSEAIKQDMYSDEVGSFKDKGNVYDDSAGW